MHASSLRILLTEKAKELAVATAGFERNAVLTTSREADAQESLLVGDMRSALVDLVSRHGKSPVSRIPALSRAYASLVMERNDRKLQLVADLAEGEDALASATIRLQDITREANDHRTTLIEHRRAILRPLTTQFEAGLGARRAASDKHDRSGSAYRSSEWVRDFILRRMTATSARTGIGRVLNLVELIHPFMNEGRIEYGLSRRFASPHFSGLRDAVSKVRNAERIDEENGRQGSRLASMVSDAKKSHTVAARRVDEIREQLFRHEAIASPEGLLETTMMRMIPRSPVDVAELRAALGPAFRERWVLALTRIADARTSVSAARKRVARARGLLEQAKTFTETLGETGSVSAVQQARGQTMADNLRRLTAALASGGPAANRDALVMEPSAPDVPRFRMG